MEEKDKEKFIKVVDMFSKDGGSFTEDDMAWAYRILYGWRKNAWYRRRD